MPLELPNLDDRTYNDLVAEALSLIPTDAPEWTNYNPSDPGITLIELFAYLSEMLIYRLNRVTDENKIAFLRLLKGSPDWEPSLQKTLNDEIRDTVLELRQPYRAITCEDFERLAKKAEPTVARAHCVPRQNLTSDNPLTDSPGHISVVIVSNNKEANFIPNQQLIDKVKIDLEPRRLLTTRIHVVAPIYVQIRVQLTLVLKRDALEKDVRPKVNEALQDFFHPLKGGADKKGWKFGRNVYVSEIYELLDKVPGVDYIEKTDKLDELTVQNESDRTRLQRNENNELIGVEIYSYELVQIQINDDAIKIKSPLSQET